MVELFLFGFFVARFAYLAAVRAEIDNLRGCNRILSTVRYSMEQGLYNFALLVFCKEYVAVVLIVILVDVLTVPRMYENYEEALDRHVKQELELED